MFAVIGIFVHFVFALEAPYLISVDPVSDSSIQLEWRNNDAGTDSFHVLRRVEDAGEFTTTVTLPSQLNRYLDDGLSPQTTYEYCLIGIGGGEISDTSNRVKETTLELKEVKKISGLQAIWYPVSEYVCITFIDSSIAEKSIDIYRLPHFQNPEPVTSIQNDDPRYMGPVSYIDSISDPNTWFSYKVCVAGKEDTVLYYDTVYTYKPSAGLNTKKVITADSLLGEIPAQLFNWAMVVGDTLLLSEMNAPDSCYSMIDISEPANPKFIGYAKTSYSDLAREKDGRYKRPTSISPSFTSVNQSLVILTNRGSYPILMSYQWTNTNFVPVDSLLTIHYNSDHTGWYMVGHIVMDSILAVTMQPTDIWYDLSSHFLVNLKNGQFVLKSFVIKEKELGKRPYYFIIDGALSVFLKADSTVGCDGSCLDVKFLSFDYSFGIQNPAVYSFLYTGSSSSDRRACLAEYLSELTIFENSVSNGDYRIYGIGNDLLYNRTPPFIHVDTARSLVVTVSDTMVSIYRYNNGYTTATRFLPSTKRALPDIFPNFSFTPAGNSTAVNLPQGKAANRINVYDFRGRLLWTSSERSTKYLVPKTSAGQALIVLVDFGGGKRVTRKCIVSGR